MAIRGPRPKPAKLMLIQKTGNSTRLNRRGKEAEPNEKLSKSGKPLYLTGRASELWDQVLPMLYWLGDLDGFKLAQWCVLEARFEEDPENFPIGLYNPLRLLGSEFCMDPTSRARLGDKLRAPDDKKKDKSFFGQAS